MKLSKTGSLALFLCVFWLCPSDSSVIAEGEYEPAKSPEAFAPDFLRAIPGKDFVDDSERVEPDYPLILRLLFQETATWTLIDQMPQPEKASLMRMEGGLRSAYWGSEISRQHESEGCSFINRLFDRINDYGYGFHQADIDSDGREDIIYSGGALCTEGDVTIIWFGNENGFIIRQKSLWQVRTLSILPGNPPRLGSVAVGCCADPLDEYLLGTLVNPRRQGRQRITKHTAIPEFLIDPTRFKVRGEELVLRSRPESNDKYDDLASDFMASAVFGNILSKYLPGCGGICLGMEKPEKSNLWYFVLVDDGCERFRTHSPFEVTAGWVQASSIILLK